MSSPFPLLRLPQLVLCEVFKSLSIGEKIKLSICSKKVSIQINNDRLYSQKVIVNLDCLNCKIRVCSENDKDTFQVSIHPDFEISHNSIIQQVSIAWCTGRITSDREEIKTFWKNNRKEGFLSIIQHLLKMFQCKISTDLTFYNRDLYEPTISELFDLQVEFKELTFILLKNQNLLWNQISSNFELVENLRITSFNNTDFRLFFTSWPQSIYIIGSAWFTMENLLACASTTIALYLSHLENKDLDETLRKWRGGGLPNIKSLTITSLNFIDNGEHILGMDWRDLDGMVIKTDDGSKKATIELNPHCIKMSVTPFEM
ncbi:hypothetical protein GCK72_003034 [Caenorhabditis remanei]|uniref:F-box domain-containing protein n=1 Tax=Caenorhabditis remanei TaxID=31234 RepID=A0A6A5HTE6_CAERE|nr:hypothetical protein GCK72_003034 [Caenorhabditis remanei]KAF1771208.1 hypothetical protein GCK72_003034 [Caenorhabditis remanei]